MDWLVYILFLLIGYWLRMLSESKKEEKPSFSMPLNPVKAVKEIVVNAKEREEQERLDRETRIMLENIDNYDGTSNGQKNVG